MHEIQKNRSILTWYADHTSKIPKSHKDSGRMAAMADPLLDALMRQEDHQPPAIDIPVWQFQ
jgi:hypothetical protein